PVSNLTIFTDLDKNWHENEWAGVMLNVSSDLDNRRHFPITGNNATQLFIRGNLVPIGFTAGHPYTLDDYHLAPNSANINNGTDTGLSQDFEGDPRPLWGAFDIGADEYVPEEVTIHTITATVGANGSVTPDGQVYIHEGRDKTFFILADPGYFIQDVIVDGESVGPTSQQTFEFVVADHTIEAIFAENTEQVTITSSAGRGGEISPPGNTSVPVDGSLALIITPDADYEIADVLVDNVSMGAISEYSFSAVSENHTIYATFNYTGDAELSNITIQLSTDAITLGEWMEISGNISPPPTLGGAFVDIAMIPPNGVTIHRTVLANSLGDFSYDLQCDDIMASGFWTIQGSWKGDYILQGDTSIGQVLTVAKAQSSLILDSSILVIKYGDSVPFIGGILLPSPQCGADLSGLPIEIEISGPNYESDLQTVFTSDKWGHFSLLNYNGLSSLGTWTLRAVFDGDDGYQASTSVEMKIEVVETAGYAIIVQGKLSNEEGLDSHNKTCNLVYNTLKNRGLQDEDIFYFNYAISQDGVDALPTWSGIEDAVTIWAREKMNDKPANLFIVMIDHGYDEEFHIDPDVVISSSDLDGWQTSLQDELTGDAVNQEIISILGFCRSGSFIDDLSGPNRVILTAAAEGESSYKGPMDQQDGIREGEYFVSEVFKAASYGKSIRQCFEEASVLTEAFTSSDKILSANSIYGDNSRQHPLLDDNGDGVGSNDLAGSGDGAFSDTLFFGITPMTGNDPGDVSVVAFTETQFLDDTENAAMLWARVDDNIGMSSLWAEIKAPGYDPVDAGNTGQATMDLIVVPLTQYDAAWDYYQPSVVPAVFTEPGIYQIYYFAKDADTGHVSSLKQSTIYKDLVGNQPPEDFHLLFPHTDDDPVFHTSGFIHGWQTTVDPDDDPITYTVEIVNDPSDSRWGAEVFSYILEGLTQGMVFIGEEALFIQHRRYVWQVKAIDQYGATTISVETDWTFEVNNDNAINGWISGGVYDDNYDSIIHASVLADGFSVEMLTDNSGAPTGYYMGSGPPGIYQLTADAPGYETNTRQVILLNGGFSTGDISLVGLGLLGDFNGDGQIDAGDLEVLSSEFGGADCTPEIPCNADADGDGDIDGLDMIKLINAL
ncbi:MAG: carboxypeptidase regulatory-like domain-containing protein, partial [Anaerolineales bacterium]|nr:carboxypeptidase regulatory-like domain-containing protein [Anaerolineales bacterium]